MNHVEFLHRYNELLFLPLDWIIPSIDEAEFTAWAQNNREFSNSVVRETAKNPNAQATDGFWWVHYLFHNGVWAPGFAEQFPEWVLFFESSPLRNHRQFYILQQHEEVEQTGYIHFDEREIPGLRAYVNADEGLYFRPLKQPDTYPNIQQLNSLLSMRHNEDLLQPRELNIQSPCDHYPFLLGNQHAPHAVRPCLHGSRKLTFVMQSGNVPQDAYDWDALSALVERSLVRFADSALWFK